jgi:hypothetical protein
MFKFTNKLPKRVCRNCGKHFSERWSSGGVGAVCEKCFHEGREMDYVQMGIVRNIKVVYDKFRGHTFEFEAKIDEDWYRCYSPCGDWSYVDNGPNVPIGEGIFSVPVGYWQLKEWYQKYHWRMK